MSGTWADAGLRVVWTDFPNLDIGDTLRDDLVAYWKMDEESGTRVDATGRGNNLTPANAPAGVSGKINNAVRLVSSSKQVISHTHNADLSCGDIDFTFWTWIKLRSKTTDQIFLHKDEENEVDPNYAVAEYELYYISSSDRLVMDMFGGGVTASNFGSPPVDEFIFVEVYYISSSNITGIRVNNANQNEVVNVSTPFASSGSFEIGGVVYLDSGYANADIDETGFVKRLLTTDERVYLYNGGNGRGLYP